MYPGDQADYPEGIEENSICSSEISMRMQINSTAMIHGSRSNVNLQTTIFNSTFSARYSIPPSLSLSDEVKFRNCEFRPIVTCFDSIGSPVVVGRGGAVGWRATPARVLPSTKTVPTVVATLSMEMALDRAGKLPAASPPQVRRLTMPVLGSPPVVFGTTTTASSASSTGTLKSEPGKSRFSSAP